MLRSTGQRNRKSSLVSFFLVPREFFRPMPLFFGNNLCTDFHQIAIGKQGEQPGTATLYIAGGKEEEAMGQFYEAGESESHFPFSPPHLSKKTGYPHALLSVLFPGFYPCVFTYEERPPRRRVRAVFFGHAGLGMPIFFSSSCFRNCRISALLFE